MDEQRMIRVMNISRMRRVYLGCLKARRKALKTEATG